MSSLHDLIDRRRPDLVGPGVVAVSGGADSVALLHILNVRVRPLVVAHFNHQLRGAASDADEEFVRELARSFGLSCRTTAVDVARRADLERKNLEETARRLRYDWLSLVARESGAAWIATGHTADDQAETVLHRLLRGAGVQGLRGIARERILPSGIQLIRPLLDVGRSELLTFLASVNQTWREDESNRDPAYTRNRIRHELLPVLRSFNPAIRETLVRLAEQAGEIHAHQHDVAQRWLRDAEMPAAGSLRILRADILEAAPADELRGMFRALWEREGWPCQDMSFSHWKRLVSIAWGELKAADLPGGVAARRRGAVLQIGPERPRPRDRPTL